MSLNANDQIDIGPSLHAAHDPTLVSRPSKEMEVEPGTRVRALSPWTKKAETSRNDVRVSTKPKSIREARLTNRARRSKRVHSGIHLAAWHGHAPSALYQRARTVLKRLGEVRCQDLVGTGKVCDRPGDFQDPVEPAGR